MSGERLFALSVAVAHRTFHFIEDDAGQGRVAFGVWFEAPAFLGEITGVKVRGKDGVAINTEKVEEILFITGAERIAGVVWIGHRIHERLQ